MTHIIKAPLSFNVRGILPILKRFGRHYCKATEETSCIPRIAKLTDRKIVRIRGRDSTKYLQGIITNDMQCFNDQSRRCLYTMLLNSHGRVLFDALIFSIPGEADEYFLETDEAATEGVIKHLKTYKLRAKVEVDDASKEVEPWVVFSGDESISVGASSNDKILAVKDPRLGPLGMRIVVPWNQSPVDILKIREHVPVTSAVYKEERYKLGVAEGLDEITSGNALPLDYNLALLNGVSFEKGCYIGQELTARTHHVGQIRKRIMPLQLNIQDRIKNYPEFAPKTTVRTDTGKPAGRLVVMSGQFGLGLIRLEEWSKSKFLVANSVSGDEIQLTASKPNWWPNTIQ